MRHGSELKSTGEYIGVTEATDVRQGPVQGLLCQRVHPESQTWTSTKRDRLGM